MRSACPLLLLLAALLPCAATAGWSCQTLQRQALGHGGRPVSTNSGVAWSKLNCTGVTPYGAVGPMVFNVVSANLSHPGVYASPLVAQPNGPDAVPLASLPAMAAQSHDPSLVAGINGGYFFRLDDKPFFDDVCFGKSRADGLRPVNASRPNDGPGDTLVVINGTLVSSNCDCYGFNEPCLLNLEPTGTAAAPQQRGHISLQTKGAPASPGTINAIAASPRLIDTLPNGTAVVAIPKRDENVHILGHTANTAAALRRNGTELLLVTADGYDGCGYFDPTCGIGAYPFAAFLADVLQVESAVNMDQGGSTTMWVRGQARDGVVSCSQNKACDGHPRHIYSGLFVGLR